MEVDSFNSEVDSFDLLVVDSSRLRATSHRRLRRFVSLVSKGFVPLIIFIFSIIFSLIQVQFYVRNQEQFAYFL